MAPALEPSEPGCLLDERSPLDGATRQDGLHLPLPDDRVHPRPEADIGEKLDEVRAPHGRAVHEVLPLRAAMQAAEDRHLGEIQGGQAAVRVVEHELHLAPVRARAARRAGEEDVVGLLSAQLVRAQAPGGPDDRVGDVRLARAIRADDDGHALLQPDLDRIGEGLEAAQGDRAQVQCAPNATERCGWRRAPPWRRPARRPSWTVRCPSRAAPPRRARLP